MIWWVCKYFTVLWCYSENETYS